MSVFQKLETLLPPRKKPEIPKGEHVEEVNLSDFDPHMRGAGRHGEAYHDDDDDNDASGPRVQCAHQ